MKIVLAFFLFIFAGLSFHIASADVYGMLRFTLKNAIDGKPVAGAKITLKDSANVRQSVTLTTDVNGMAMSPPLETRTWFINVDVDGFLSDPRSIPVAPDTVIDLSISLQPIKEKVIKISSARRLIRTRQTAEGISRNQEFMKKYPANAGNPQSITKFLGGNPGFVQDSVNQVHPRGEHSGTAIYINGFELPGVLQGRAGEVISAETVEDIDLLTGGYAPEYGGETAAVLNINLKSGPIKPIADYELQAGGYNTQFGALTFGGQAGAPLGPPDDDGNIRRRFGYLLNFSGRQTDNALEPPEPDNQSAHNHGLSQTYFGNFDYTSGDKDRLSFTANTSPALTQIANRTGLPDSFASFGQGYGYGGALSRTQAAAAGIVTQQAAGQDIVQQDLNSFALVNWRHTFDSNLSGLFSVGIQHSTLNITNNNPSVNIFALPANSSIEFNPTLLRDEQSTQVQGNLTLSSGSHTWKGGFLDDEETGKESYQFIPASGLALDQLFNTSANLSPAGTLQVNSFGNPILDSRGVQVYLPTPGAAVPTLSVARSGFYRAAYLQDTWSMTKTLSLNYGIRYDRYRQSQNLGFAPVDQSNLSPRVNFAYAVTPTSVFEASFNRLFTQPPQSQGAIIGRPIVPETLSQYEASYEFQVAPDQTIKIDAYYKDVRHELDTALLFSGTQIGAFTTVNFDLAQVHGQEFSYNLIPHDHIGWSAYFNYTHQIDKEFGLDNTGAPAPLFDDHDQRHTVGAGFAYTWPSEASIGANIYYGSGLASSPLFDDHRIDHAAVNLIFSTGSKLLNGEKDGIGLSLAVENLFDSRQVLNFNSGFSGTRFQQGRRVLFSLEGKF